MATLEKLITNILSGRKDSNISFNDLRKVVVYFGFIERIRGDHYIYSKDGVDEIINIQPVGNKSKAYQVKQVRNLIHKYKFGGSDNV